MKISVLKSKIILVLLFSMIFPIHAAFSADLIFTAPPRESAQAGQKLYAPVAKYLSQLLNRKVTYKHPGNWFSYQNNMRKDKYDIIFDGPHFISWRVAHINHEVLLKLPGELKFMVVTNSSNAELNEGKDLIGKIFCGISPPNLSSLSFLASFKNPVLQPKVKGIKGGMGKVFKAFSKNECPAAVLRNTFYKKKLTDAQQQNLKIIFNSQSLPNQAISVSSRLSRAEKDKMATGLVTGKGASSTNGIIKRFGGKKVQSFVTTTNEEYKNYNSYLEGVIFGW